MAITNATSIAGLVGASVTFAPKSGSITAQNITGTAGTFSGNVSVGGTLTYEDVTNIDSVGLITARDGLQVLSGITTISGQTNLTNTNVATGIVTVAGQTSLANVNVSAAGTVATFSATKATVTGQTTLANLNVATGIATVVGQTNLANVNVSASSTFGSAKFSGVLVEAFSSTTTAWSSNANINISNGNFQFCSANLGGTNNTLNIRSNTGINTDLAVGEAINVTAITAVNASTAYVNRVSLDGNLSGITTYWVGGSVPSDGGSSGVDTYSFNILKLGNNTFTIVANQIKTS